MAAALQTPNDRSGMFVRGYVAMYGAPFSALLIWRAVAGYEKASGRPMPFHQSFLVLPVMQNLEAVRAIRATRDESGLMGFIGKFNANDFPRAELLNIAGRVRAMRAETMRGLQLAVGRSLIDIHVTKPALTNRHSQVPRGLSQSHAKLFGVSEKFGHWMAREQELGVFAMLGVRLK